jgi:hypothetical protein
MLEVCTNISVELALTAADVLPHMLTAHQPAIVHAVSTHKITVFMFFKKSYDLLYLQT